MKKRVLFYFVGLISIFFTFTIQQTVWAESTGHEVNLTTKIISDDGRLNRTITDSFFSDDLIQVVPIPESYPGYEIDLNKSYFKLTVTSSDETKYNYFSDMVSSFDELVTLIETINNLYVGHNYSKELEFCYYYRAIPTENSTSDTTTDGSTELSTSETERSNSTDTTEIVSETSTTAETNAEDLAIIPEDNPVDYQVISSDTNGSLNQVDPKAEKSSFQASKDELPKTNEQVSSPFPFVLGCVFLFVPFYLKKKVI